MTDYTRTERTERYIDYRVPGGPIGPFMDAYREAGAEYRRSRGLSGNATTPIADDWALIRVDGDHIVITVTVPAEAPPVVQTRAVDRASADDTVVMPRLSGVDLLGGR